MIPLEFFGIYTTSILLFFVFLTKDYHEEIVFKNIFWSSVAIVIMGIVNSRLVKQSFWLDVFLPVFLICFTLTILLTLLDNYKLFIFSKIYKNLHYSWPEAFVLCFVATITTAVFALRELNLNALVSFSTNNAAFTWVINSYLFWGGFLSLVIFSAINGLNVLSQNKCLIIFHDYGRGSIGCTCRKCGKTIPHQWNGCKCKRCREIRQEGHQWNGCKCQNCGTVRDQGHKIDGCVCKICRREFHDLVYEGEEDYSGDNDQLQGTYSVYRCTKCGVRSR
jgi:hypothetical protein